MSKYNLQALHDKEVTSTITRYLNGRASEDQVSRQLDKIFVSKDEKIVEETTEEVKETTEEVEGAEPLSIHDKVRIALDGKKDDLIAFAEEYGIDLSEATNNELRIAAIQDWYNKTYFDGGAE